MRASGTEDYRGRAFAFGDFRLTTSPLALMRGAQALDLQLQPLKLLALMVSRRGEVVSHAEIRDHLWDGRTVDFKRGIHVCIRQIRSTLNDDASAPVYVGNVPGQGYRFIAAVREISNKPNRFNVPSWRPSAYFAAAIGAVSAIAAALFAFADLNQGAPMQDSSVSEVKAEARDTYERGVFLLDRNERPALERSIRYFDDALSADPKFADAHSAAARAYERLADFRHARMRAARALALDSDNAAAHAVLGRIALHRDWAWEKARIHFETAIQSDGAAAEAFHGLATYYMLMRDFDRGLELMARARTIDPASTLIRSDYGWFHYYAGNYETAIRICGEAADLAPEVLSHRNCMIYAMAAKGDFEAMGSHIGVVMAASGAGEKEIANVRARVKSDGVVAFHRWRYDYFSDPSRLSALSDAQRASLCAAIGERECAFEHIENAVRARDPHVPFITISPAFSELKNDAGFQAMIRKIGLG